MNRLTRYDKKQKHYVRIASRLAVDNTLGKLEDIEEQLGCPLDVVFKALKNGIWRYEKDHVNAKPVLKYKQVLYIDENSIRWLGCWSEYLKDYQKTWWLKEDKTE